MRIRLEGPGKGFIEKGTVSIGLRGVIAESWQRSQDHGIPVERKRAPLALEPELLQRYSAHSTLVEAARPALSQARLFLAEANSMIILTDPSGISLRKLLADVFALYVKTKNFRLAHDWS
jgi:sigma-54 dependent transcriptional regulator, acetoin dehydrogenase operon transcriptional activator AcoR